MARDIEEFLRKAAERRAAQQKGQRPAGQTPPPAPSASAPVPPARRPVPGEEVIDLAGEPNPFPTGQTVAEHVRHIDSGASEISQHARQLGREVGETGQKAQQRVQQNLDHEVGQLTGGQQGKGKGKGKPKLNRQSSQQAAVPQLQQTNQLPPAAIPPVINSVGLGQWLRTPQNIRQAIIVSELLKRPEWD